MPIYHLGLDDTDSLKMGCTTYIAALLIDRLLKTSSFIDYPNLIRLNPNIPWKSRGNAAICLRFESDCDAEELLGMATEYVEKYRDREDPKNQPGIAICQSDTVPVGLKNLGKKALSEVVPIEEALNAIGNYNVKYRTIRGGRGIVGALAAIGNTLEGDHTFELAVYRGKVLWGKKREVDFESVRRYDSEVGDGSFNNIDLESKRLLVTPHGPDPVLFGIRGESPPLLMRALDIVKFAGGERWVIYRSNQGTDAHLSQRRRIGSLKPYMAAVVEGTICKEPIKIHGGHVVSRLSDGSGEVDVAAYEPSAGFRNALAALVQGDAVRAYGGVKVHGQDGITLNLERMEVVDLVRVKGRNPRCPGCGKRMKSEGKGKGYQCRRCGRKERVNALDGERKISVGNYLPPPKAMRHLTKPLKRYSHEKSGWSGPPGVFYGVF